MHLFKFSIRLRLSAKHKNIFTLFRKYPSRTKKISMAQGTVDCEGTFLEHFLSSHYINLKLHTHIMPWRSGAVVIATYGGPYDPGSIPRGKTSKPN
jgi:hypothetical protein